MLLLLLLLLERQENDDNEDRSGSEGGESIATTLSLRVVALFFPCLIHFGSFPRKRFGRAWPRGREKDQKNAGIETKTATETRPRCLSFF